MPQRLISWQLLVILTLTLLLSLYQVAVTACVTEDSVGFIHYARQLIGELPDADREPTLPPRASPLLAWLNERVPAFVVLGAKEQHPGYPVCLLAVHQVVGRFLADDKVNQWVRSGQLVSVLAGCVLAIAHFLLGRRLLGQTPAFVAGLLLATVPAWVYVRCDVLSDMSALACLILSMLFAVRLLEGGSSRDALLCGLTGAVGYLFRIEVLQVVIFTSILMLAQVWRRVREHAGPSAPARLLRPALIMALPLVLLCLPYMHLRGSFLTKQARVLTDQADGVICEISSSGKLVVAAAYAGRTGADVEATAEACEPGSEGLARSATRRPRNFLARRAVAVLPESMVRLLAGVKKFFLEWSHNLGGWLLLPVLVGLGAGWRDLVRRPGQRLIGLLLLFNLLMLPGFVFCRKGYLDHRHVLPVAALSCLWCWPGLVRLGSWLATLGRFCRLPSWRDGRVGAIGAIPWPSWLAALFLTMGIAGFVRTALSCPLHGERNGYRLAGLWLRGRLADGEQVIDPEGLASIYADCDDRRYWDTGHRPLTNDRLEELFRRHAPVAYMIVSDRYLRDHGLPRGLPASTGAFRLTLAQRPPASLDPDFPFGVGVYRVERTN